MYQDKPIIIDIYDDAADVMEDGHDESKITKPCIYAFTLIAVMFGTAVFVGFNHDFMQSKPVNAYLPDHKRRLFAAWAEPGNRMRTSEAAIRKIEQELEELKARQRDEGPAGFDVEGATGGMDEDQQMQLLMEQSILDHVIRQSTLDAADEEEARIQSIVNQSEDEAIEQSTIDEAEEEVREQSAALQAENEPTEPSTQPGANSEAGCSCTVL